MVMTIVIVTFLILFEQAFDDFIKAGDDFIKILILFEQIFDDFIKAGDDFIKILIFEGRFSFFNNRFLH